MARLSCPDGEIQMHSEEYALVALVVACGWQLRARRPHSLMDGQPVFHRPGSPVQSPADRPLCGLRAVRLQQLVNLSQNWFGSGALVRWQPPAANYVVPNPNPCNGCLHVLMAAAALAHDAETLGEGSAL